MKMVAYLRARIARSNKTIRGEKTYRIICKTEGVFGNAVTIIWRNNVANSIVVIKLKGIGLSGKVDYGLKLTLWTKFSPKAPTSLWQSQLRKVSYKCAPAMFIGVWGENRACELVKVTVCINNMAQFASSY